MFAQKIPVRSAVPLARRKWLSECLHGFAAAAFLVLPLYGLLAARDQVGNFMLFGALAFIACPSVYRTDSAVYRFGLWLLPVLGLSSIWAGLAFEPRQMSRVFLGFSFFLSAYGSWLDVQDAPQGKPSLARLGVSVLGFAMLGAWLWYEAHPALTAQP
jgi:hypothetical protein